MQNVILIIFLAINFNAFAEEKHKVPAVVESPSSKKEKENYTAFKPAPKGKLRELISERPGITVGPITTDPGHFIIETSLFTFTKGKIEEGEALDRESSTYGFVVIRGGISNSLEAQVLVPGYQSVNVKNNARESTPDFSDIIYRLKYNFQGNDEGPVATGVMGYLGSGVMRKDGYVPSGPEMLGGLPPGSGFLGSYFIAMPSGWKTVAMAGAHYSVTDYVFTSTAFTKEFYKNFSVTLEIFQAIELGGNDSSKSLFGNGLIYKSHENLQFNVGTILGLNPSAEDIQLSMGFTYRI